MAASSCARPRSSARTYYDTADLRLARAGASLRYRRGDDEPWTVKVPTDEPGSAQRDLGRRPRPRPRRAACSTWSPSTPAARRVEPVIVLQTARQAYQLCDRDDRVAVEVVDDTVSVTRTAGGWC